MQSDSGIYGIPRRSEPSRSVVYLTNGNGFGSTAAAIRRYSNIQRYDGLAITYLDDAINGCSLIINEDGNYNISRTDYGTTATYMGASINAHQVPAGLTTNISSLPSAYILTVNYTPAGNTNQACITIPLKAGDIVRPHSFGVETSTDNLSRFVITKVS